MTGAALQHELWNHPDRFSTPLWNSTRHIDRDHVPNNRLTLEVSPRRKGHSEPGPENSRDTKWSTE